MARESRPPNRCGTGGHCYSRYINARARVQLAIYPWLNQGRAALTAMRGSYQHPTGAVILGGGARDRIDRQCSRSPTLSGHDTKFDKTSAEFCIVSVTSRPLSLPPTPIYHITDVANLTAILTAGGLISDARLAGNNQTVIGYSHIKQRRMTEIRVPCCNNRYVGEFVPFYYCPRSPMLYTINIGKTGRPPGCQRSIVHLVSTFEFGTNLGAPWAVSDGNAGAFHTVFYTGPNALAALNWTAIGATSWSGLTHQKHAEFLVADAFPWHGIVRIGCHNSATVQQVQQMMQGQAHQPQVSVEPGWYY